MTAGCAVPGTWSPDAARRVPPGLGGTRSPQNSRRLHNRRLSSPRKASLMRGVRGGSGAAGGAGCRTGDQGIRARARGVRGNLPEPLRSEERAKLSMGTHCPYPGMCGRKGPGARTRGRRRHPRKLGGTPPRSPGGARAAEETAYPLAPRSPRGSRWGRWSEGVLTRPKPQAARYPAGCPPLSAAKCGEAEEACPNVSRGCGGMCPPSLPSCDEGEAKLPISARYLRAWAAQASRGTRPSPPLSCGVARRWQRRALPTSEAGGRAVSGGAGGPAGAAAPEELLLDGKNDARTQRSCGQRGLLAPRYPARGAGRCRGAVSAAILRRAPRSGWFEGVTASDRQT